MKFYLIKNMSTDCFLTYCYTDTCFIYYDCKGAVYTKKICSTTLICNLSVMLDSLINNFLFFPEIDLKPCIWISFI